MTPKEKDAAFLAELVKIWRAIGDKNEKLADFLGAETVNFLDKEVGRLKQVVLHLSGVTAKQNEYYDKLVELGAANMRWSDYLNRLGEFLYLDDLDPMKVAMAFLDYADGTMCGTIDNLDEVLSDPELAKKPGHRDPTNAELVKLHGLLPPRQPGHNVKGSLEDE